MGFATLVHDGSNAVGSKDSPDKEGEASSRHEVCFDREKMSDLVDRKPDGRKREEPEEKERDIIAGIGTVGWEGVGEILVATPD